VGWVLRVQQVQAEVWVQQVHLGHLVDQDLDHEDEIRQLKTKKKETMDNHQHRAQAV
jgi:hypothetical protein